MAGSKANRFTSAQVIALGWPTTVPDDRAMIDGVQTQGCRGSPIRIRPLRSHAYRRSVARIGIRKESAKRGAHGRL